jgi:hypothetical protein
MKLNRFAPGAFAALMLALYPPAMLGTQSLGKARIRVGVDDGDIRGTDHRALQFSAES